MNQIIVTAETGFETETGTRLSCVYSIVDETGKVLSQNNRFDRLLLDDELIQCVNKLKDYAKSLIEAEAR